MTEKLTWNSVEDWDSVKTTPDTYPMHTHLFTFKVMGRDDYDAAGDAAKNGKRTASRSWTSSRPGRS